MNAGFARSLSLSTCLHAAAAAFVFFVWIRNSAELPVTESNPIMVLETGPDLAPASAASNEAHSPLVHVPIPVVVPSRPSEDLESMPPSAEVLPHPTSGVKNTPAPRQISYADWRKQHPQAGETHDSAARPAPVRHVSGTFSPTTANPSAHGGANAGEPAELGFVPELLQDLREVFVSPESGAAGLSTVVEFQLQPDGRLTDVRIVYTSGMPEFDRNAIDAFRFVRARSFSPAEAGQRYRVTFRASDN